MTTDWLPELTDDDLAVLIKAVVAWESKDSASQMMGDIVGAMVMSRDPASIAAYERKMDEEARKRDREKAVRREQSVLLRAKLADPSRSAAGRTRDLRSSVRRRSHRFPSRYPSSGRSAR